MFSISTIESVSQISLVRLSLNRSKIVVLSSKGCRARAEMNGQGARRGDGNKMGVLSKANLITPTRLAPWPFIATAALASLWWTKPQPQEDLSINGRRRFGRRFRLKPCATHAWARFYFPSEQGNSLSENFHHYWMTRHWCALRMVAFVSTAQIPGGVGWFTLHISWNLWVDT